jgi:hypothetical protein
MRPGPSPANQESQASLIADSNRAMYTRRKLGKPLPRWTPAGPSGKKRAGSCVRFEMHRRWAKDEMKLVNEIAFSRARTGSIPDEQYRTKWMYPGLEGLEQRNNEWYLPFGCLSPPFCLFVRRMCRKRTTIYQWAGKKKCLSPLPTR